LVEDREHNEEERVKGEWENVSQKYFSQGWIGDEVTTIARAINGAAMKSPRSHAQIMERR
jgi:hypothetical protein